MLLNRVILKYCTEEAVKETFACARTPRLRLRLRIRQWYLQHGFLNLFLEIRGAEPECREWVLVEV